MIVGMERRPYEDQVSSLARWLEERIGAMAEAAVDAIWDQVPAYATSANAELRREVHDHCAQVFVVFVRTLAEGRPPEAVDFPWTTGHASRRSDIPITDFLKAFRIGQMTMWEFVVEGTRSLGSAAESALEVVSHVMRTIEVGSSVAASAYVESARFQGADDVRIQRDLLEDLLAGRPPVVDARLELLADASLATGSKLLVGVAKNTAAPGGMPILPNAAHFASLALAQDVHGLVVVRQDEVVGVFPVDPLGEDEVVRRVTKLVASLEGRGIPLSVGISTVRLGLAEVPLAYDEARLALETLDQDGGVLALSSLSTLDYLVRRPDPSARGLIKPEIRDFIAEDQAEDGVFVDTLRQYVAADMNAKAAAQALHIHVNTVYYRLDRIAERTGCDLRKVDQVIDLLLAVRLLTEQV